MTRDHIRFIRNGAIVRHVPPRPTQTLLDYLRLDAKAMGTKEGCNEGDCGACTVVVGTLRGAKVHYEAVNACILLMAQIDGKELITVDDLALDGVLHPVQQAMVDFHASQCGFCTPGFVMSLFALYHRSEKPDADDVRGCIAGNLCRCTGYRPIVDAALASCNGRADDAWARRGRETAAQLAAISDEQDLLVGDEEAFSAAPRQAATLTQLADWHPDATIVAGATDVGLWITKQMRPLKKLIFVNRVSSLREIVEAEDHVRIGAAATYAEAEQALSGIAPDLGVVVKRIGSEQVRASGTVGGNIANGSPIGDMPPMLIALGATLILRHGDVERRMALEDYFIAYGKQDRVQGELVWAIDVPKRKSGEVFKAYKISKRFDQDISAVMGAFKFVLNDDRVLAVRIAYGGMAATPKRAVQTEAAVAGVHVKAPESWTGAVAALAADYQPISDMRASAQYRLEVAQGLLRKALLEIGNGQNVRVLEAAE